MSNSPSPTPVITLPAVLDMRAIEPLAAGLAAVRGQPVALEASAVERLGGLCLQLLLSAIKTWKSDGHALTFLNVSEALAEQWQGFGASPEQLVAQDAA
ncbi:STAS domain-containing protein [uncultured Brevundimonas sp.]|uniref:STAS domain-containing protein n=1 Tax=uncultured Brevundimonas sp. TaxID=213418 RepID=UPI0026395257|nr:STAS domain-containing protein [uncultured Brevundimonas sp.]